MFWVRVLPWWVFLAGALLVASITVQFFRDYLQDRRLLDQAIAAPPELISLQDLPQTDLASPLNEFLVTGFSSGWSGLFDTGNSTRAFLVLASADAPTVYLAFTSLRFNEGEFEEFLATVETETQIRGLLKSTLYRDDIAEALVGEGVDVEPSAIFMAKRMDGDREAELRAHVNSGGTVALLGLAMTALFLLVSGFKYRAWRRRRR